MPEHAHMLRIQPCGPTTRPLCVLMKLTKTRDGGGSSDIVKGFSLGIPNGIPVHKIANIAHLQPMLSQGTWISSDVSYALEHTQYQQLILRNPKWIVYQVSFCFSAVKVYHMRCSQVQN